MSNVSALRYELQKKFISVHYLIENIYQYKVDNLILLNSTLSYSIKARCSFIFNFTSYF